MLVRLAALAFLLGAPVVAAQPPPEPVVEFSITGDDGNLAPESEVVQFGLHVAWSCSLHELQNPNQITSATFEVVEKSENLTVTLAPVQASSPNAPPTECTDDAIIHAVDGSMQVSVNRRAPAFVAIPVVLHVTLERAPPPDGSSPYESGASWGPYNGTAAVTPDYLPSIQVLPDSIIQSAAEGAEASFNMTVINFSNGPTRVAFELIPITPGLDLPAVDELALPGPDSSEADRTALVEIHVTAPQVPSASSRVYSFDAKALAWSDQPAPNLDRHDIVLPLSLRSVDALYVEDVPSTGLLAALMGVSVAFALRRRT